MLRPPRVQVCAPSIATPRAASRCLPFREFVLADGERDVQRAVAVVARDDAARHGDGLRRAAALEHQQHVVRRDRIGA